MGSGQAPHEGPGNAVEPAGLGDQSHGGGGREKEASRMIPARFLSAECVSCPLEVGIQDKEQIWSGHVMSPVTLSAPLPTTPPRPCDHGTFSQLRSPRMHGSLHHLPNTQLFF